MMDPISQGAFNTEIVKDLFGNGIFVTDGDKWRHQRKLASHEFSTKVLRDYSSDVFWMNAMKLAEKTSAAAANRITINLQVLPQYKQYSTVSAKIIILALIVHSMHVKFRTLNYKREKQIKS